MSRKEIKLQRRVRELEEALRPFMKFTHQAPPGPHEIFVPTEGPVWLYVGHSAEGHRPHLHTDDFRKARRLIPG